MKKKGFTLVELLVVIAIIAMLLAILMPALGKVRQLAQRIMCSTNLSGLGKAMLTYSNDDKYESFPIGGASGAYWSRAGATASTAGTNTFDWRISTFVDPKGTGQRTATLSSCLYLLVKIADTTPDQFICPGSDNKKFELNNYDFDGAAASYSNASFSDVWDFGAKDDAKSTYTMGKGHNTYSYQLPLPIASNQSGNVYPISTTSNPARPVMADRNPYWTYPLVSTTARLYSYDATGAKVYADTIPNGNNTYHQKEGQNVLYADNHAKFEKQANCGIQMDNIYTYSGYSTLPTDTATAEKARQCGKGANNDASATSAATFENPATTTYSNANGSATIPIHEDDSYLVSDVDNY
ncbi:MAG TPA: hypothetical protein DDX75_08425 [Phycisphaerales bacterium]|nr:hypothetical protein [Phycisphaerales bacterium]